jgi:hypothetical protein
VFRRLRTVALADKIKFNTKIQFDHLSLPLASLPILIKNKTITYTPNVSVLRELEKSKPNLFSLGDIPPLKANYLMHESAHLIARNITKNYLLINSTKAKTLIEKQNQTLVLFLEESFANTCESIANAFTHHPIHNEFLYKNSYIMESEATRKAIRHSITEFGFNSTFKLMLLGFLSANFLLSKFTNSSFQKSLSICFSKKPRNMAPLKWAFMASLNLDPEFTNFTNQFYLRLIGFDDDLRTLINQDYLLKIKKDIRFNLMTNDLCNIFNGVKL